LPIKEDGIMVPEQYNRGYSGLSQLSLGLGKKDSFNEIFSKIEKNDSNNALPLLRNFSQDFFNPN
jgi:hypothetical protein